MAKLKIVYAVTPDRRGPDLTRMGQIEEHPDDLARVMVAAGEAVYVTEEGEPTANPATQAQETAPPVGPPPVAAIAEDWQESRRAGDLASALAEVDLTAMTKAELTSFAEAHDIEVPSSATKIELLSTIKRAADGGAGAETE